MGRFTCVHCGEQFGETTAQGSSGICPTCYRYLHFKRINKKKEKEKLRELLVVQKKILFAEKRLLIRKEMDKKRWQAERREQI